MKRVDVVVIGAGASGLMCAMECAARGRSVAVLDHARQSGNKVRVSGGGRCNFTNLGAGAEDYRSSNPHFVKSALARYTPWDFIAFMEERGLSWVEEEGGKLFCVQGARAVADLLLQEARSRGAEIVLGVEILGAVRDGDGFRVDAALNPLGCSSLVIASGGLSWPQIGATNLSYVLAKSFGLEATSLHPGLVPFLAPDDLAPMCRELAGASLPVRISGRSASEGSMLFTHRGISGPAVLDASLFWRRGDVLAIDLLPGISLADALNEWPRLDVRNGLARLLPRKLAAVLCERRGWGGAIASISKTDLRSMEEALRAFPIAPKDTEGYAKAEVTLGGVDTAQVSSKTMEAKAVPGLFVIGEALDVTGRLGGFNLHWAWASGFAAGQRA